MECQAHLLKKILKIFFKKIKLDNYFNINKIEFTSFGDDHEYFIPQYFDGENKKASKTIKDETKEIVKDAIYQLDKWLPEIDEDDLSSLANIKRLVSKYIEEYYAISAYEIFEDKQKDIIDKVAQYLLKNK